MKLKPKVNKGRPFVVVTYEGDEWANLQKILADRLHLEKLKIKNGWGEGIPLEVYTDNKSDMKYFIFQAFQDIVKRNTLQLQLNDNINDGFWHDKKLNVAFLRVVPDDKGSVEIPLDSFLTIGDLNSIANTIGHLYKTIMEVVNDVEITIQVAK